MAKKPTKDTYCFDCDFTWVDNGGDSCPACGSTDIVHVLGGVKLIR